MAEGGQSNINITLWLGKLTLDIIGESELPALEDTIIQY